MRFVFLLLTIIPALLTAQNTKKVLIIGMDGCRSDALTVSNTPNIDGLISNAIYSPDALNTDITISGPGWSAILCGVWSDKHLVTGNDFSVNNYQDFPSIFKYVEEYNSDLHTFSLCHWGPINDFIVQDDADFKLNVGSDEEVADLTDSYMTQNDPDLTFLHFDDIDHAGHSYGFSPTVEPYRSAIEKVDSLIGIVIRSIQNRSTFEQEDWLILVTTDHGGNGTSHGGSTFGEQNVFFIVSSLSISPTLITKDSTEVDNTVFNCLQDSTELKFDGIDDQIVIPYSTELDFMGMQDFTLECRVRTNQAGDVAIIGNKDWNSGSNSGFVFSFKFPSGPEWKVNIGDGDNRVDINTGGQIADNEWHTLSVSFDRDGFMKMYQDGDLIDSADIANIGDISTDFGILVGADSNNQFSYEGAIAEVRVWDSVLNEEEIKNYSCTSLDENHPNYSNLKGYWKLNDIDNPTETIDQSVSGLNGSINGASYSNDSTIIIYNYDNTPRLTDIPPTALAHLCIPVNEEWVLDGKSWISECEVSTTNNPLDFKFENLFKVFPNPSSETIRLEINEALIYQSLELSIFDINGVCHLINSNITSGSIIDIGDFPKGAYSMILTVDEEYQTVKTIIKH